MTTTRLKNRTRFCLSLAMFLSISASPVKAGPEKALTDFHQVLVETKGRYSYEDQEKLLNTLEKSPSKSIELLVKELAVKLEQSKQPQEEGAAKIEARELTAYADLLSRLSRKSKKELSEKSSKALIDLIESKLGLDSKKNFDANSLKKRLVDILGKGCANEEKSLDQVKSCLVKEYNKEFSPYAKIYIAAALADLSSRGRSKTDKEIRDIFLTMLKSDCPGLRRGGAEGLKTFASSDIKDAPPAVTTLLAPLQDNYLMVRRAAAYSLRDCGPEAAVALPVFTKAAESESEYSMKAYSMHALSCIGSKDPKIVELYLKYLKNPELEMLALGHMKFFGQTAVAAAPEIASYLDNKDAIKRRYAAECLGYLGNNRDDILELLQSASLKDPDPMVRSRAEASLKKLKDRQSL